MNGKELHAARPYATLWMTPEDLPLGSDEMHVWRCFLNQPEQQIEELATTLTDDEAKRAERFHFQRDRLRFITTRGVLRIILGGYLGSAPGDVRFSYGRKGKPSLTGEIESRLCFNVSHSHDLALFAF